MSKDINATRHIHMDPSSFLSSHASTFILIGFFSSSPIEDIDGAALNELFNEESADELEVLMVDESHSLSDVMNNDAMDSDASQPISQIDALGYKGTSANANLQDMLDESPKDTCTLKIDVPNLFDVNAKVDEELTHSTIHLVVTSHFF